MPEVLQARRPLGTLAEGAPRTHGSAAAVLLGEQPIQSAYALRFDAFDEMTTQALVTATGLDLTNMGRAVVTDDMTALWLGPGDWLIKPRSGPSDTASIDRAKASTLCVLVDVSDLWFAVRMQGPRSRELLGKGCALDLDPGRFAAGASAVTQFARVRALIHHVDSSPAYDIHVERSYAGYLWAWLVDAMNEFLDQ